VICCNKREAAMHPMLRHATKTVLEDCGPWERFVVDENRRGERIKPVTGKIIQGKIGKYPVTRYPSTTSESMKSYSKYPFIQ
jgi:hypothetical protein